MPRRRSRRPVAAKIVDPLEFAKDITVKFWGEPSIYLMTENENMQNLATMDFLFKAAPKRGKVWWQGAPRSLASVLLDEALAAYRLAQPPDDPVTREPSVFATEERERNYVECARLLITEWKNLDWRGNPAEDLIARRNKGLGLLLEGLPTRYPITAAMVRQALEAVK